MLDDYVSHYLIGERRSFLIAFMKKKYKKNNKKATSFLLTNVHTSYQSVSRAIS